VCQGVLKESLLGGVLVVEVTLRATPGSGTDFGLCCISKFRYSRKLREDPRKHVRHRPPTPMRAEHVSWARLHNCFVSHQLHTLCSLHVNSPYERLMPCLDAIPCLLGSHLTYHPNKYIAHRLYGGVDSPVHHVVGCIAAQWFRYCIQGFLLALLCLCHAGDGSATACEVMV
jgi:hypothetical protein